LVSTYIWCNYYCKALYNVVWNTKILD